MDADGLIGVVSCGILLPWNRAVIVRDIRVEITIPASLKSDIGIVHCLQVEVIDRSWAPDICGVAVDDFRYGIINI